MLALRSFFTRSGTPTMSRRIATPSESPPALITKRQSRSTKKSMSGWKAKEAQQQSGDERRKNETKTQRKTRTMKNYSTLLMIIGTIISIPSQLRAQSYAIDWFTVGGGGGTGGAGAYEISATVGQSIVETSVGGNHLLDGGFWSFLRTTDVSFLHISRSGANLVVTWPNPSTGF